MDYILASQSPRREQLLKLIIDRFEIIPSNADENIEPETAPIDTVMTLARRKADAIALEHPDKVVISADTIVVCQNMILGKPESHEQAKQMLTLLADNTHQVVTGVCIAYGEMKYTFYETTDVTFFPLSQEDIDEYAATDEPMDKAGAYAAQGRAGELFIKRIDGDRNNVIGLPVDSLKAALENMNLL